MKDDTIDKNSKYWASIVTMLSNQIYIETIKEILKDKEIISGDMEFESYMNNILGANDNDYIKQFAKAVYMRNYHLILENDSNDLDEDDEKFIRSGAISYLDECKDERDVDKLISNIRQSKQIHSFFKINKK